MYSKNGCTVLVFLFFLVIFSGQTIASTTVTDTSIGTTGNLTLGEKITFAFSEAIDNIVDGWITVTGNFNITGNATVSGTSFKVNNKEVCLADGTNCQSSSDTVWNLTGSQYLYNGSGILSINDTKLNSTIDARDSDTTYSHLTNFTDDILWTTAFNSTGDSRWTGGTDTQKNATGYLYNDSTTVYLNDTKLNATIDARDSDTTYTAGSNLTLAGTVFSLNVTGIREWLNGVYADISVTGDNSSWNKSYADTLYADISVIDTQKNATGYLYNDSTTVYLNDTKLNATIDARDSDTTYSHLSNFTDDLGTRGYINNLNFTNGANYWNATYATFNKTYADTLYAGIGVTGDNSSWNESYANTLYADISVVDTDTQKNATGYLYNDSTTIYLNDTKLNATINSLENDTLAGLSCSNSQIAKWNSTSSAWECENDDGQSYIAGDGITITGTEINASLGSAIESSEITDSTIIDADISDTTNLTLGEKITFTLGEIIDNIVNGWITVTGNFNVTGNATVSGTSFKVNNKEVCLADGTNCQVSSGSQWNITTSQYLYNNSDILEVNETKLNATIDSRKGETFVGDMSLNGSIVISKDRGYGIKVDTSDPSFGWRDLLGEIKIRGVGSTDPADAVYIGGIRALQFALNDECWANYHIPHDYVNGTDLYLHFHWSHNSGSVTGGSVNWSAEVTYAKGHNQSAFISPITLTIVCSASTTQYQHMICETQLSSSNPSANQLNSSLIEPDGIIFIRGYLSSNDITGAVIDPFLHYEDIHYQSTNIATKDKVPDFYT